MTFTAAMVHAIAGVHSTFIVFRLTGGTSAEEHVAIHAQSYRFFSFDSLHTQANNNQPSKQPNNPILP